MSPIQTIIKSISISADEIGIVESVRDRLAEIGIVDERCRPNPAQWNVFSRLHNEAQAAADELAANPSLEAANRLHTAIMRSRDSEHSIEAIACSLRAAADRIRAELGPVIARVFSTAAEKLAAEIETRRREVGKGTGVIFDLAAEVEAFNTRAGQLVAALEAERAGAMQNPLPWLQANGIGFEPEAPAPAPAPAQPVKSYRGKVRLDKTAEVETQADDVLSGLADEDEIDLEDPLAILTAGT